MPLANPIWERHQRGKALFTIRLKADEVARLRQQLQELVVEFGIEGLRASPQATRDFALYASHFLAQRATRLEWSAMLRDIDVPDADVSRYPDLYEPLVRALFTLNRPLLRQGGERRFLATLLREGGLPTYIGDLSAIVVQQVTQIGWQALEEESARTWAVLRVQQSATTAARRLLDSAEGRFALADFLGEAARARAALLNAGIDPTTLSSVDAVKSALGRSNIALPAIDNESLLVAVLGSFSSQQPSSRRRLTPLRLAARLQHGRPQILLRVELDALEIDAVVPRVVSQLTMTAVPSPAPRRRLQRAGTSWAEAGTNAKAIDFERDGQLTATSLDIRFTEASGALRVIPVDELPALDGTCMWFDEDGELISERRDQLSIGESLVVVIWDATLLSGEGGVDAKELAPPRGAKRAYRVDVHGVGRLHLAQDDVRSTIDVPPGALVVSVLACPFSALASPGKYVNALPDLVIEEGAEVELFVRAFGSKHEEQLRRGVRGRLTLSADRRLRELAGTLRVRLVADDGRAWSASWCVLPRGFNVTYNDRTVFIAGSSTTMVRAAPGVVARSGDAMTVTPPPDASGIDLFLHLPTGECLRVRVPVAPARVELRADDDVSLPLDGSTQLTERELYAGAHLLLQATPGAQLEVKTLRGDVLLAMRQPAERGVRMHLMDLARAQQRRHEATMTFVAGVTGAGERAEYEFTVHIPRFAQPAPPRWNEGDQLQLEVSLDDKDIPSSPAVVFFPVRPEFAVPKVLPCELVRRRPGSYIAHLRLDRASSFRGRHIAFVVDAALVPERPMSGGRVLSLSPEALVAAKESSRPQHTGRHANTQEISTELQEMLADPDPSAFFDDLATAVIERARYGLWWFHIFETISSRFTWFILAAAARLPLAEREHWIALWPAQTRNFSWLRIRREDTHRLAQVLPPMPAHERAGLVEAAHAAHRMPLSIQYVLHDALFSPESLRPLRFAREAETNMRVAAANDPWRALQLPTSNAGRRWLRGVDFDGDDRDSIEDALGTQLMEGRRARAIRALFVAKGAPQIQPMLAELAPDTACQVLRLLEREWQALRDSQLAHRIAELEIEVAAASLLLCVYREGGRPLEQRAFQQVLSLEYKYPALLDFWLIAANLLAQGRS